MSDAIMRAPAVSGSVHITGIAEVFALAKHLSRAQGFVPKAMNGNEGSISAAILTGLELGIGPMQALRSIHVIDGRATVSAELMLALAIERGVRHQWLQTTAEVAEIRLTRPGFAAYTHRFTIAEAQAAGLTRKDNWRTWPAAMLRARCASTGLRAFAPDVLGGGIYTPEEMGATVTESGEPIGDGEIIETTSVPAAAVESLPAPQAQRPLTIPELQTAEEVCETATRGRKHFATRPAAKAKLLARAAEIGVRERDVLAWLAGDEPEPEAPPDPDPSNGDPADIDDGGAQ